MSKKEIYIAHDLIDGNWESFETIKEAQEFIEESILDDNAYHPDMKDCFIAKICQRVSYDVLESKKDYSDEEWQEEGYSLDYDEIWKHKFIEVKQNLLTVANYAKKVNKSKDWIYKLAKKGEVNVIEIDGVKFVKLD